MDDETLISKSESANEPQSYLWVEGSDDVHVFKSLLDYHKIPYVFRGLPEYAQIPKGLIEIVDKQGIDNLLATLEVQIVSNSERRLAVVVDADTSLEDRWKALRNILIKSGYTVPIAPDSNGTILEQKGLPIAGIWLMPNNIIPGMIEHFASFLVQPNNLLWDMAGEAVQKVVAQIAQDNRFPNAHAIKAHLYTWLAWQKKPGTQLGRAITKNYLNAAAPPAQQLIVWLRRLFGLETA